MPVRFKVPRIVDTVAWVVKKLRLTGVYEACLLSVLYGRQYERQTHGARRRRR